MSKKKKEKKPKVKYIDDGRTIADMSSVGGNKKRITYSSPSGSLSDKSKTFFGAMRMMIKPMLITMAIITAAFFLVWLLLMLSLL